MKFFFYDLNNCCFVAAYDSVVQPAPQPAPQPGYYKQAPPVQTVSGSYDTGLLCMGERRGGKVTPITSVWGRGGEGM